MTTINEAIAPPPTPRTCYEWETAGERYPRPQPLPSADLT
jgi:hypothetical protein